MMSIILLAVNVVLYVLLPLFLMAFWLLVNPVALWKQRKVPGPWGWPLYGNLMDVRKMGMPKLSLLLHAKYGPVFKIWFGRRPIVVVADPEAARRLSYQNVTKPSGRLVNALLGREKEVSESNLVVANGTLWRSGRKIFDAALLHPSSLRSYTNLIDANVSKLVEKLMESSGTVDLSREFGKMTLSIVGSTAYGVDFGTLDHNPEGAALIEACNGIFSSGLAGKQSKYNLYLTLLPQFSSLICRLAYWRPDLPQINTVTWRRRLFDFTMKLMKDARETSVPASPMKATAATEEVVPPASGTTPNFLKGLVDRWETEKGEMGKMTDVQVVAFASTFILGGYETMASVLTFSVYLLSVNPEKQALLIKEIDEANLPPPGTPLTVEDLEKVPYAEACVKEALRIFPPLPLTHRQVEKPTVVAGVPIEPGTYVQMNIFSIHRNPQYWKEPESYLPERFLPGNTELGPNPPSAYLPFGDGPRMCVGYKFALQLAKVAMIRIYQQCYFNLEPLKGQHPLQTVTGITMGTRNGLWVKVNPRQK